MSFRLGVFGLLIITLLGCQGTNPVYDTFKWILPSSPSAMQLSPAFEFMVVGLDGRSTVLALGERSKQLLPEGLETHEYWYSSQHEMLHLVNGRIHQALGFTVEWRSQESTAPRWSEVQKARYEVPWSRVLNIMPGYRYGQVDHLWVKPAKRASNNPLGVPTGVQWFEESVVSQTADARPWAYQQRFAVLNDQVVYSEQCLSPKICLSLRPLGVERRP